MLGLALTIDDAAAGHVHDLDTGLASSMVVNPSPGEHARKCTENPKQEQLLCFAANASAGTHLARVALLIRLAVSGVLGACRVMMSLRKKGDDGT